MKPRAPTSLMKSELAFVGDPSVCQYPNHRANLPPTQRLGVSIFDSAVLNALSSCSLSLGRSSRRDSLADKLNGTIRRERRSNGKAPRSPYAVFCTRITRSHPIEAAA